MPDRVGLIARDGSRQEGQPPRDTHRRGLDRRRLQEGRILRPPGGTRPAGAGVPVEDLAALSLCCCLRQSARAEPQTAERLRFGAAVLAAQALPCAARVRGCPRQLAPEYRRSDTSRSGASPPPAPAPLLGAAQARIRPAACGSAWHRKLTASTAIRSTRAGRRGLHLSIYSATTRRPPCYPNGNTRVFQPSGCGHNGRTRTFSI